jgi:hypothetical protein
MTDCIHLKRTLICLDAGRGGLQYRTYCRVCWACTDGPIGHDEVARAAVAGGRRPKLHSDGSVLWAPVVTTDEIERRRSAAKGRR